MTGFRPLIQLIVKLKDASPSIFEDSIMLYAKRGLNTFNSNCPLAQAKVTATSFPNI